MSSTCTDTFERLARQLGDFGCEGANQVMNLHNPFGLENWTLLVIELTMLIGVVLSLRHAVRRRKQGDPTGLAIWLAAVAYGIILEPPLYFPHLFGLQDQVGLIFVHNEFTVQFLFNRLPLYIACLYPAMAYLAYELVRATGVFEKRGPLVSAITVGFVHQCFYEIFDHLGPQLSWWIWGVEAPTNQPALKSVPLSSMVVFGAGGVIALTFLVRAFVTRPAERGTPMPLQQLILRGIAIGVLMPLGLILAGLPGSVFGYGAVPNHTAQTIAYSIELAIFGAVAIWAVAISRRDGSAQLAGAPEPYLIRHATLYLVVLTILWMSAIPSYIDTTAGLTAEGTPPGSLPYAVLSLVLATGFLAAAVIRPSEQTEPAVTPEPAQESALT